jgi:hypothetical protein
MPNTTDADQVQHVARVYAELQQLFEEAQQLQIESAQILALAHQDSGNVLERAVSPELGTAAAAPLSPEETLDSVIALLASCSFETQVNIIKTLALCMASVARARADIRHPLTA